MDLVRENLISQSGGLITEYQISSAYDAAYRAAGRDLGHVGNNAMSAWLLPKINEKIGGNIKKAVKDKNWNKASLLMATNIITKTALFPFKGGGYNWVVLTLEKLGLPIGNIERGIEGEHTIDMSTQVGMNKLKTNLYNKQVIKSTNYRNGAGILMGGLIAAGAYMTFRSGDEDDNDPKSNSKKLAGWLEDNEWAKSYFYKLSPSALSIITSRENKEMGMLLYKLSGSDDPLFDKKLKFFKNLEKNDGRGMGRFGEAMGSPFNVPVPSWKWGKDIAKVYKGINDMEIYKVNQDVNTIENGMLKGGFFEWTGLRPENAEVEKEISLKKAENGVQDSKDFSNSELDKELSKRKEKENLTDREVVLKKAKTKKEGLEDELKEVLLQLRAKENNTVYLKQNGKPKVKDKKSGTKYLLGRKEYLENKIEFIKKESKN
jgi:hypothetical protein